MARMTKIGIAALALALACGAHRAAAAESGEPEYDATVVLARSMSVREAIDKFDRDGRQPLVFLDEETGGLHLFYANGDGERRLVEILTEE